MDLNDNNNKKKENSFGLDKSGSHVNVHVETKESRPHQVRIRDRS